MASRRPEPLQATRGTESARVSAPLESTNEGPVWLTGGAFGPEDSILNILVMASAVLVLASRTRRKVVFVAGSWGGAAKRT